MCVSILLENTGKHLNFTVAVTFCVCITLQIVSRFKN